MADKSLATGLCFSSRQLQALGVTLGGAHGIGDGNEGLLRKNSFKKKKKNHLKLKFTKLSHALSKSDHYLYSKCQSADVKGAPGSAGKSAPVGGMSSCESKKSNVSLLIRRIKKGWSRSVDVQLDSASRKSSCGEVSVSSDSSSGGGSGGGGSGGCSGIGSNSSWLADETKGKGFEVISPGQRRMYYFNDSIDSAEDALGTIQEYATSPFLTSTASSTRPHKTNPSSKRSSASAIPTVVIHYTDNKQKVLTHNNSLSLSARRFCCLPSVHSVAPFSFFVFSFFFI